MEETTLELCSDYVMDLNLGQHDYSQSNTLLNIPMRKKNIGKKSNQRVNSSSQVAILRTNLKIHSGGKSSKCKQCDYECSDPSALRTHMKRHSGEKSNKCNQCDYASFRADSLRKHLKTHNGENQTNAASDPALTQVL